MCTLVYSVQSAEADSVGGSASERGSQFQGHGAHYLPRPPISGSIRSPIFSSCGSLTACNRMSCTRGTGCRACSAPSPSRFLHRFSTGRSTALRLIASRYRIERCRPEWEASIERRFAGHAAAYVTNSPTVRTGAWHTGCPLEKFTVIPPGVPPSPVSDVSRAELLRELQLPPDARLIGVIGRLVPEKRVQDLIWAADLLRVLHDNLRMLIIGTGPAAPQLEQYARLASDLDHIRFLGERDDVWRIMPHLDVLWNGSDNRSSFNRDPGSHGCRRARSSPATCPSTASWSSTAKPATSSRPLTARAAPIAPATPIASSATAT